MPVNVAVWSYIAFTIVRLIVFPKRWQMPTLRGPGWFFHVQVGSEFWEHEGRGLLREYRFWLLLPYAIEAAAVGALVYFDRLAYLYYLILPSIIVFAAAQILLIKSLSRKVRGLQSVTQPEQASGLAITLETRRVRDYNTQAMEIAIAAADLLAIGILLYLKSARGYGLQQLFFLPALLLYAQAGLLLLKEALVLRRSAIPAGDAESHLRFREAQTRYWMRACDWPRALFALMLLVNALTQMIREDWHEEQVTMSVIGVAALFVLAAAVDMIVRMNRILAMIKTVRPVDLSRARARQAEPGDFALGGLVYFNRDNPSPFVRNKYWLAPNLANRRAYLWGAYLCGFFVFGIWSKVGGNG